MTSDQLFGLTEDALIATAQELVLLYNKCIYD